MHNSIRLVVGDWSGDGHEKTQDIWILSNRTEKQIQKAYKAGTKQVGFDLSETVCRNYEDCYISKEKLKTLASLGMVLRSHDGTPYELEQDEDRFVMEAETFADMYLFIASLGDPDLKYQYDYTPDNHINIGGYGLFH